ncbi:MAG: hypothetical protein QHG99_02130 [Methanomicrobiales archaeon]|nr:hypothetical protein [Methanomicrobiales archaeon]
MAGSDASVRRRCGPAYSPMKARQSARHIPVRRIAVDALSQWFGAAIGLRRFRSAPGEPVP